MTPGELIDALGGAAAVAERMGLLKSTVGNWRIRGFPAWALISLQKLCDESGINPRGALEPRPRAEVRV